MRRGIRMYATNVAMEEALEPNECVVMRKFLKSLVYGKKLNPDLDVSSFIHEYRRILNGYTTKKPRKGKRLKAKVVRNPKPWSIQEKERLKELYKDHTNKELMDIFNRSYSSVATKISEMGLKRQRSVRDETAQNI